MKELDSVQENLDKIKATRDAAIKAQLKEQEIKENNDNYRLNISEASIKDIKLLKSIQKDITNSIVIDKIIWSNYYQPLAKIKFPKNIRIVNIDDISNPNPLLIIVFSIFLNKFHNINCNI